MSDTVSEDEEVGGELTHLPNIAKAPIPEVEAVLRTADHWHFDAFRLAEASQGYPLSTLGFWLIQQNRVAKEFSTSLKLLRTIDAISTDSSLHMLTSFIQICLGLLQPQALMVVDLPGICSAISLLVSCLLSLRP